MSCNPIDLAAGGCFSVHITATTAADECSTYYNTVKVTMINDVSVQSVTTFTCTSASIHVLKTSHNATVNAGVLIGFKVAVNISGTCVFKGVSFTDNLPAGSGAGVTWSI